MNIKTIGGVLAVLASIAAIGSFATDLFSRDVTVNIQAGKSQLDIPSFDFSLDPLPGARRNPKLGEEFNKRMGSYLNKDVYLSITLSKEMTEDVRGGPDEYGRYIFVVEDNIDQPDSDGAEYLIHLLDQDKNPFDFKVNVAKLAGYFKVYNINGPRGGLGGGGFMSVNLRPVRFD